MHAYIAYRKNPKRINQCSTVGPSVNLINKLFFFFNKSILLIWLEP